MIHDSLAVRSSTAIYIAKNSVVQHCRHTDVPAEPAVISTRVARGKVSDYVLIDDLANTQYKAENDFLLTAVRDVTRSHEVKAVSIKNLTELAARQRNLGPSFVLFSDVDLAAIRPSLGLSDAWGFGQVAYAGSLQGHKVFGLSGIEFTTVLLPGALQATTATEPLDVTPTHISVSTTVRLVLNPDLILLVEVPHG